MSLQIDLASEKELSEKGFYKISPSVRIPMLIDSSVSNTTCITEVVVLNENISNQMINIIDQCQDCESLISLKKMLQSGEYTFLNIGENIFYDIIDHKSKPKEVK